MNEADVSKQIQQMVQFIKQEAEEKANEIAVATEEVSLTSWLIAHSYNLLSNVTIGAGPWKYCAQVDVCFGLTDSMLSHTY